MEINQIQAYQKNKNVKKGYGVFYVLKRLLIIIFFNFIIS